MQSFCKINFRPCEYGLGHESCLVALISTKRRRIIDRFVNYAEYMGISASEQEPAATNCVPRDSPYTSVKGTYLRHLLAL